MENQQITGRLYDIQSFSVQDGPGVRTTAFLKGCPLHCPWCHSPESQAYQKQLSWISMRCQGTDTCQGRCLSACKKGAIRAEGTRKDSLTGKDIPLIHVDRSICDNCGDCCNVCYPGALYLCGEDYTVDALLTRLLRDRKFFRDDGGVTISGGEALVQAPFVLAVLMRLKEEGIHTALDTTGYAPWEVIHSVMPYTDLFLYDLKHMDSQKHESVIGVPNERILENAKRIAENGGKMQIRIPVIPKFNDDEENIRKTAEFCLTLGTAVTQVQLLPYHNLGVTKYMRISDKPVLEATPPSDAKMETLRQIFSNAGIPVRIH